MLNFIFKSQGNSNLNFAKQKENSKKIDSRQKVYKNSAPPVRLNVKHLASNFLPNKM